jgi:hypothetical protein
MPRSCGVMSSLDASPGPRAIRRRGAIRPRCGIAAAFQIPRGISQTVRYAGAAAAARGRSSVCHGRTIKRSVLKFSVSVMIAAKNGPYRPPAYSCASQRHRRKWDREFESALLQRRVCEPRSLFPIGIPPVVVFPSMACLLSGGPRFIRGCDDRLGRRLEPEVIRIGAAGREPDGHDASRGVR